VKHAHANKVTVQLIRYPEYINLSVEDNGRGFDYSQAIKEKKGIGLGNILSRVDFLKGRMNVDFKSPLARFGYDDLLLAVDQQKGEHSSAVATGAIKGSIVLLARTDKGSRTLLFPTEAKSSAGELCARAITTIQDKAFIHRVSHIFDFSLIALMMAFSCFYHRFKKRTVMLISFAGLLGYLFLSMSVYEIALIWLPIVLPVGLLLLINFFSLFSPREAPVA